MTIGSIRYLGNLQWNQWSETYIWYCSFEETNLRLENLALLGVKEFQDGFRKKGKLGNIGKIWDLGEIVKWIKWKYKKLVIFGI